MAWTESLGLKVGSVEVATSKPGYGHSPEFWAQLACNKIMHVADSAPMPVREQAIAFKSRMEAVILHYMKQAVASQNTTLHNDLTKAGYSELTEILRRP